MLLRIVSCYKRDSSGWWFGVEFCDDGNASGARLVHLNALEVGRLRHRRLLRCVRSGRCRMLVRLRLLWVRIQRRRLLGTLFWGAEFGTIPAGTATIVATWSVFYDGTDQGALTGVTSTDLTHDDLVAWYEGIHGAGTYATGFDPDLAVISVSVDVDGTVMTATRLMVVLVQILTRKMGMMLSWRFLVITRVTQRCFRVTLVMVCGVLS